MKILVVENDSVSRKDLERRFSEQGFPVLTACDGGRAWDTLLREDEIRLVLADWKMPGLKGPELCRKIRGHGFPWYTYIILITAEDDREDVIRGLDLGADDFMTRPIDMEELNVRVNAGMRIVHLNERLRAANDAMHRDLESGRRAQRSLLPRRLPRIPGVELEARFLPSRYLSGDIYNILRLDESHIGLFNMDISGHGIQAALFGVGIYHRMNNRLYPGGLLKIPLDQPPHYTITPPEQVARKLDTDDMLSKHGHYFTMLYAVMNLKDRGLAFYRAGHNLPLLIHSDGSGHYLDGGGPPIGMGIPQTFSAGQHLQLSRGDSFVVFSDGINDARDPASGEVYGLDRIRDFLTREPQSALGGRFDRLIEDVRRFQGGETFGDDLSILGMRIRPGA